MKQRILPLKLLLLLLIVPVFASAQSLDESLKEIDAYAERAQKDWNVPGMAIRIVKDDKVVFAKGGGMQRLGTNERVWRPAVAYNFPPGFVVFTIDKNGKPGEMEIDQPNNDFWFYELEFKRKADK